jgi:hypothetical protein
MDTPTLTGGAPSSRNSQRALLATAALVSVALWFVPFAQYLLYPIRIFVTLIHEGGHAVATVLTGGSVAWITVDPDTSGLTQSLGGVFGLIAMAGYVGATAFGAFCLQLSRSRRGARSGLVLLGAITLLVTGLWVRPFGPGYFAFISGAAIGIGLIAASRKLSEQAAAFLLSLLSVQLCLNAIFDLRGLIYLTTSTAARNDAVFMTREYGFTPWFWAFLWAGISLVILGAGLRAWWRGTRT